MIEVKEIRKSFGEHEVLKGIDASFYKGKTNLIIGQSGSGKTVFLKSLVGLHDIDSGEIEYDGTALGDLNRKDRKSLRTEMGMVFQGNALFDSLTIEENVTFALSMFSGMSAAEKKDRADFCLERVNLPGVNQKFPSELSGGMQKRVAIARAISMNPKYLFCDEPNSGLDPKTAIVIDQLLQEITQEFEMTTVINTHDMNSVIEIGDHIIFIKDGKKAWQGTGEEILGTDNAEIVDFVYSSELFKKIRRKV
ncbi:ABC transporter ATP-binding protein [Croceimicrobium hydrocarbonivorans]|uniref:ATP-binding cassette domain-containing protein n=1 Tax=Croceimicrobium hydrocarbonivorans TaxID=2761580 RepID=A0A7H0VHV0_9FLAO|nr:ATP-binding cassette domain-containing protein [Croceimicrobium hydrocarbonivorans]QNR25298.1 ATP-binding cassette domain-containing protein [Croceimicrobium hydrocarbonivorans]